MVGRRKLRSLVPLYYLASFGHWRHVSATQPARAVVRCATHSHPPNKLSRSESRHLLAAGEGGAGFGGELAEELGDGDFELAVATGEIIFGRVIDEDVGLDAVVFHVGAAAVGQEDADGGCADR